jgi:hypothetical protein
MTTEPVSLESQIPPTPLHHRLLQFLRKKSSPLFLLVAGIILLALATIYHCLVYLPSPNQPHRLTVLDDVFALGVVLLISLVGLGIGQRVLRYFNLQGLTRLERAALALGLGWGILSLSVLVLGLAQVLFAWLLMAGLVMALLVFWRDVWGLLTSLASRAWFPLVQALAPRTLFEAALVIVVGAEVLLLGTQALTLPIYPRGWDVYIYHWAIPQLFLLHHAVYSPPGWANADFPLNTEMLSALALAFDVPLAAALLQMVFGLLVVLLISGFLYRHAGRLEAWLAAALCLGSPLFTGLLTSGYVEMAVAYYGAASLTLVLVWVERNKQGDTPLRNGLLTLAGLFAGFGVGAKYQMGQTVVGILLVLVGVGVVQAVLARRKSAIGRRVLLRFLSGLVAYSLALVLVLLPWLLRDWLLIGNPIYPFVWGGPGWNEGRSQVGVEWLTHFGPQGSLWLRLAEAFFRLFRDNGHMDDVPYLPLNYLLLLSPLLVILEVARTRPKWRGRVSGGTAQGWAWLVVVGGAYVTWVVSHATSARYAMPWVMLLVVPTVIVLVYLYKICWNQKLILVMVQLSTLALLVQLGPVTTWQFWARAQPLTLLTGQVSLRRWEELHLDQSAGYWRMVDYVNTAVPRDAKLLLAGNGFGFFIEQHDYVDDSAEDWVSYIVTAGHTPSGMVALLRQEGFSYLIYQEHNLEYIVQAYKATSIAAALPAFHRFLASALLQVQVFDDYTLYRIPSS